MAARLRARWVLPITAPPIADGALLVDPGGRIAAVGRHADVPVPSGVATLDLGDVALLPGLVNTHAHLELTALRGLVRDLPFRDWIQRVRTLTDALGEEQRAASAAWGVLESFAAGITTIGDTGSSGTPAAAMAALGARGVAYHEVFGPDPARCAEALAGLAAGIARLAAFTSDRVAVGVSPHAPYTVSGELLRAVAAFARGCGAKVAMHLAESREETAFVRDGRGPFAEALAARGIAVAPQGCSPVAWAARGGLLDLAPLLIHCVETDAADTAAIARASASVAHCPHSNAELGHGRMDLRRMRAAGVTVGLGTDSVASGAPLDLFRAARLARDAAGLTPAEALRMMTADGAAALGLANAGVLAPGAWADLVAIHVAHAAEPAEAVLAASPSDVRRTWVAGRVVWDGSDWPGAAATQRRDAADRAGAAARAALS